MTAPDSPASFRLAYVPGVTPGKWVRVWGERVPEVPLTLVDVAAARAAESLWSGAADAALLRLPVDRTRLNAIPLYTETTVVVLPRDHPATVVEELGVDDLSDEVVLHPLDDTLPWERPCGVPARERPASTADAVALVAAGVGVVVVPQSLARLHHRRDLGYRPVVDAPGSNVALCWPAGETSDLVEEFIGIVRGRTVNSSRGRNRGPAPAAEKPGRAGSGQPVRRRTTGRPGRPRSGGQSQRGRRGRPGRRG